MSVSEGTDGNVQHVPMVIEAYERFQQVPVTLQTGVDTGQIPSQASTPILKPSMKVTSHYGISSLRVNVPLAQLCSTFVRL